MTIAEVLPMPSDRRHRLKELETIIGSGFEHAVEAGKALREIRDSGLYLEVGARTFEHYCQSRWSLPKRNAYYHIDSADIHDATCTIVHPAPIMTESVARELSPLLHQGGDSLVVEAWEKVSERFRDQRPPTASEVHKVLVEEGYREQVIGPSSGKVNRRVRLGQCGDKLISADKRLNYFITRELGEKPLAKADRVLAGEYADRCEAMMNTLRVLADGRVPG